MFQSYHIVLVPIALSLLGVKAYFDGYKLLNDWGDIAVAGFTGIVTYMFIVYQKSMEKYYNTSLIILENRMNNPVYIQWGDAEDTRFGYGEYIPLEPNQVKGRRVQCRYQGLSGKRPCVRIFQSRNNTDRNVTIILWEPNEKYHTKVYRIEEDGITEARNPTVRQWHTGEFDVHRSSD